MILPCVTGKSITKIINSQLDIKLGQFTPEELNVELTKIKNSKAAGLDEISPKVWKSRTIDDIIEKSDLTDKMKCSFFQATIVSILLYGCTTWTLTKRLDEKLNSNYTRMLRASPGGNKSGRQHPKKQQLYCHLRPIMKIIQVRRTRHARHCWRSREELISEVLL